MAELPPPPNVQPVDIVKISDDQIFQNMLQELQAVRASIDQLQSSGVGSMAGGDTSSPRQGVSSGASRATPSNTAGSFDLATAMGLGQAQSPSPGASGVNATSMLRRAGQIAQAGVGDATGWTPGYQREYVAAPGLTGDGGAFQIPANPNTPDGRYPGLFASTAQRAGQMAIPLAMFNARSLLGAIPGPAGMAAVGGQYGTFPGTGDTQVGIGPFQTRVPLGQMGAGVSQTWDSFKTGITTPGLSTGQVMASKASLADLGWTSDRSGFGPMTDVLNSLQQQNPQLDPSMTAPLLDQATRLGATSLEDFRNVMSRIPDAAKSAQVSVAQMIQDMTALGEANQGQGGTFAQGAKLGPLWSGLTGLPSTAVPELMQNPFVSAYATRSTGLMPQMQGIMGPGSRIQSIFGAVNQLKNMTSFQPYAQAVPGSHGQFSQHFSANAQNLAWMHSMIPEASHEMLKAMTNPKTRQGVMAGANIMGDVEGWQWNVRKGRPGVMSTDPRAGKGNWGDMIAQMRMARGTDGQHMFSHDQIAALHDLNTSDSDVRDMATKMMGDKGGSLGSPAGKQALRRALAKKRGQMINNDIGDQGDKARERNGPHQTIGLTAEARRFFTLNNKRGSAKNAANAGAGTTNSGYELPTDMGSTMHDIGQGASDAWDAATSFGW